MAITDKEQGVWELDQVYNKINQGSIWEYEGNYEGNLYTWGSQNTGGLGHNNNTPVGYSSPKVIPGPSTWSDVMGGGVETYMMAAVKSDGTMWTWGSNVAGMLGINQPWPGNSRSSPVQVGSDTNWAFRSDSMDYTDRAKFCAGQNHMLAIKTDGTLWGWGVNSAGQLGQNDRTDRSSPKQVGTETTWAVAARSKDGGVNCLKTDGTLWVWGYNALGTLGIGNKTSYSSPVQVPGTTWQGIMGQGKPVQAIKTNGTLWMWGPGEYGQLGINSRTSFSSPCQIGSDSNWRNCGTTTDDSAFAIKTDGSLWSWGNNQKGELGHNDQGNPTRRSSPTQVGTGGDQGWINTVQSSDTGILAVKDDGTLWAWGNNSVGNLGLNNKTDYSSPVQIGSGTDWTKIGNADAYGFVAFK